jgi:hypothetical protein
MKYNINELTPKSMQCLLGGCPKIYEVTPENQRCISTACPSIHQEDEQGNYLIVGKVVNPSEFGLEGKVGEGEVLIKVPKALIDEKEK